MVRGLVGCGKRRRLANHTVRLADGRRMRCGPALFKHFRFTRLERRDGRESFAFVDLVESGNAARTNASAISGRTL